MKKSTNNTNSNSSEKIFSNGCFCDKKSLSSYIYKLMREKDLVAPDVYKRADVSKANWSNYISEKTNPSPENARRLTVGLKCTPSEASELLSYCGMTFIEGNRIDECFIECLQNKTYKMVDVYSYIDQELFPVA